MNLETDIIGKYVEKLLTTGPVQTAEPKQTSGITKDFLTRYGF